MLELDTAELKPELDADELVVPVDGVETEFVDEGVAVAVWVVCVRDAGEVEPPNVQSVPRGI